jgi:hypothetical protein
MSKRLFLTAKQQFALATLVKVDYAASGLSDSSFADHAAVALGFEIHEGHVTRARGVHDLAPNKLVVPGNLTARVEQLEAEITKLKARIQIYFSDRP